MYCERCDCRRGYPRNINYITVYLCDECEKENEMKITIDFDRSEVKEIIKAHVLKEIPVPTASKKIDIMDSTYGTWKVTIEDKEAENDG